MIDENLIQIREYHDEGYRPLVSSAGWCIAILNFMTNLKPSHICNMERHLETDEAFILLHGRGVLILGENGSQVDELTPYQMDFRKIYNIRSCTWHTILLSQDASVLVVENSNTGAENSEICDLNPDHRSQIIALAKGFGFVS